MNLRLEFTVHGQNEDEIVTEINRTLADFAPHAQHWRTQVTARLQRPADMAFTLWEAEVTAFRETQTGSAMPR